jgi:hypothetical protein
MVMLATIESMSSRLLSRKLKTGICKTIVLLVVLYGCETWLLARLFENRVLRKVLGPKKDEVVGRWRKVHNEELRASFVPIAKYN